MGDYYILEDGEVLPVNVLQWGLWWETTDRRIALTDINDEVSVSTVFLGLDHGWGGAVPVVFETMIFGGPHDQYQERYSTLDEARAGHNKAVAIAKGEIEDE